MTEDSLAGRRRFLQGMGALGAATVVLGACSSDGDKNAAPAGSDSRSTGTAGTGDTGGASTSTGPATGPTTTLAAEGCVLDPELTSGPYYLDHPAVRRDITEGRPGAPMEVHFTVVDATTCKPIPDAAVDIWHCDANGEYSGFNGNTLAETQANGRNDKRYLRGVQLTDAAGEVTFTSIYPGWYEGRAIHIHLKVFVGGHAGSTYDGGHVSHIGQVFFDDTTSDALMKTGAYAPHTGTRTRNDEDSIYRQIGDRSIMHVTQVDPKDMAAGFRATAVLVVDPSATPKPAPMF